MSIKEGIAIYDSSLNLIF